ncbi:hypothetical protein B0H12DRAFT_1139162 [Mycena haematopus]|nr:hypothetical protein B0H12DRAFT_1139162 [Mycena haematopus]
MFPVDSAPLLSVYQHFGHSVKPGRDEILELYGRQRSDDHSLLTRGLSRIDHVKRSRTLKIMLGPAWVEVSSPWRLEIILWVQHHLNILIRSLKVERLETRVCASMDRFLRTWIYVAKPKDPENNCCLVAAQPAAHTVFASHVLLINPSRFRSPSSYMSKTDKGMARYDSVDVLDIFCVSDSRSLQ